MLRKSFLSYESETKDAGTGAPLTILEIDHFILNFPRKCQSASMTWDRKNKHKKLVDSNNLTMCSENLLF